MAIYFVEICDMIALGFAPGSGMQKRRGPPKP